MTEQLVAGVDSSTQSCKVLLVDPADGRVLDQGQSPHPDGTEVAPAAWYEALRTATGAVRGHLDDVAAVAVAGQQHGMVALDAHGSVVRDALLWNDVRSAPQARRLADELGARAWVDAVGSVPIHSLTVSKLAWLAENEPEHADRVADVLLPHDWLTWQLLGGAQGDAEKVTDRSEASGTGYWSADEDRYREDLLAHAFGRVVGVPRVLAPSGSAGRTPAGTLVGPGLGDNAAAALGLGLRPGEVAVSLGTSGAVFASADDVTPDPSGELNRFADGQGRLLPLSCTMNAARVLGAVAQMVGEDLAGLERLQGEAAPDADGLVLLPYLDGERTPALPEAAGSLHGMRRGSMTPANVARAGVLGMLCGIADALDVLRRNGVHVESAVLVGGAARSAAVRGAAPDVFGVPVSVPRPAEYVALGAARQAAWVLSGDAEPPEWDREVLSEHEPTGADWGAQVRERYAGVRRQVHGV
ncbi:xylulokinase [Thalassiella azotivora]